METVDRFLTKMYLNVLSLGRQWPCMHVDTNPGQYKERS
jgi:hypothetical protein